MPPAGRREKLAWALYDFANSGYTTVVLTTVYNAFFVGVVAAGAGVSSGTATFLWTLAVAVGNGIVLLTAPVVGAVADHRASKKRFLMVTTVGCVLSTALLGVAGDGALPAALLLLVASLVMFGSGEYLIAAFLPEIAGPGEMGRVSGYGWGLGYFGGLLTLGLCLAWITWAEGRGVPETEFVPVTLWITAAVFALAALPTFLVLRERAVGSRRGPERPPLGAGFARVRDTLRHARRFRDLFRFLLTLLVFQSGISTVIVVAAIYAQEELAFDRGQLIVLIMVVNLTAAVGAFAMGQLQDRIGSARSLGLALCIWILAISIVHQGGREGLWLAANLMGLAMGATQSAGRALIGQFTPVTRSGEFFGLWGLAMHLAMIIGPLSYGIVSGLSGGDQRLALLSTLGYFVLGLVLLVTVDEGRGRQAAAAAPRGVAGG